MSSANPYSQTNYAWAAWWLGYYEADKDAQPAWDDGDTLRSWFRAEYQKGRQAHLDEFFPKPKKYTRKARAVEAYQLVEDKSVFDQIIKWLGSTAARYHFCSTDSSTFISIENCPDVNLSDWIVKDEYGEFHVYTDAQFRTFFQEGD